MPHSRCNCRCVMCDIWKANQDKKEISVEALEAHVDTFRKLRVREVVFSGGEALMHSNLWALCRVLKENGIKITLLSTGLLLERNAKDIITFMDNVIISVDGSEAIHDQIRNIPDGYKKLMKGIAELKKLKPDFRITGRCVLQRFNYKDFINIVRSARAIQLDQISFLAADVSTSAFNHGGKLDQNHAGAIALTREEAFEFEQLIKDSFSVLKEEYKNKFIAEAPEKMTKIVQYYFAVNGLGDYPAPVCNAPWVSAVIESNGDVMPCFFHKPYGNIYENDFTEIINSPVAINFRKDLNMDTDSICKKCVCSLKLGLRQMN
jgi:MoaA/NifB/PqqE/SkfB family radical SAM enzyme